MNRYKDIRQRLSPQGRRYYSNTTLPTVPLSQEDIYIITTSGDRLDNLSQEFYNSTKYWWVIAAANPNKFRKDSYFVEPGIQIRVPISPENYITLFDSFNKNNRNY